MAEYAIWEVKGGPVQKVLPMMVEEPSLLQTERGAGEPVPDPAKVEEVQDEIFDVIVPGIKYRKDATHIMHGLRETREVDVTLKLIEKMEGGKFCCRDWVQGMMPKVEFDPSAEAQAAAASEPIQETDGEGGKVQALSIVPNHQYPRKKKKKRTE